MIKLTPSDKLFITASFAILSFFPLNLGNIFNTVAIRFEILVKFYRVQTRKCTTLFHFAKVR